VLRRRMEAGNEFEAEVFARLTAMHGADAVLVDEQATEQRVARTLEAMRAGRLLVLGGGCRTTRPVGGWASRTFC
jgi:hypothetical protein